MARSWSLSWGHFPSASCQDHLGQVPGPLALSNGGPVRDRGSSADTQAEGKRGPRAERADGVCPHAPPRQEVPEGPGMGQTGYGRALVGDPGPSRPRLRDSCPLRCCPRCGT